MTIPKGILFMDWGQLTLLQLIDKVGCDGLELLLGDSQLLLQRLDLSLEVLGDVRH